jgi:hypothetical protein
MDSLIPFIIVVAFAVLVLLVRKLVFPPRKHRDVIPPYSNTHIRKP